MPKPNRTPEGRYRMSLPKVDLSIGKNSFTFKGCNSHRLPCTYRNNKIFFGKPVSTNFKCASDNALNIINILPSIVTFKKDLIANTITFFNQRLQSLFTIGLKQGTSPGGKIFGDIFEGTYGAQLPDYRVQVGKNNLSFQGCKDNAVSYDYNDYGFVSFKKKQTKQRNRCSTDNDNRVVDYLRSSARFSYKDDNSYSIQDDYGNDLVSCSPYK